MEVDVSATVVVPDVAPSSDEQAVAANIRIRTVPVNFVRTKQPLRRWEPATDPTSGPDGTRVRACPQREGLHHLRTEAGALVDPAGSSYVSGVRRADSPSVLVARTQVRTRLRSLLVLGVLTGVTAGFVIASLSGA